MTDELVVTAHHEAAHALVALLTGCELARVTIVATPGRLGQTIFRPQWRTPPRRHREAILRHLAGPAAEALHLGLRAVSLEEGKALLEAGATDFRAARRACAPGSAREMARQLDDGWRRALASLDRRWTTVQRLAELLLAEGTVPGSRVRKVAARGE